MFSKWETLFLKEIPNLTLLATSSSHFFPLHSFHRINSSRFSKSLLYRVMSLYFSGCFQWELAETQTPFKKQHGRYLLAHIMPYCLASGKAWSREQTMQSGISCFSKRPCSVASGASDWNPPSLTTPGERHGLSWLQHKKRSKKDPNLLDLDHVPVGTSLMTG